MISRFFRPFSACAKHARIKCVTGYLFRPLGMAIMLSLVFPNFSQGATLPGAVFANGGAAFQPGEWETRGDFIQFFDRDLTNGQNK